MPEYVVDFSQSGPPLGADGRLDASAFHRNHVAIWSVLAKFLEGRSGDVLEIGSGTGQHATEFSRRAPAIAWWPTDFSDSHLRSIAAWRAFSKILNMQAPVRLDASARDWALNKLGLPSEFVAMFCANVIHISPWTVSQGLMAGAARHLAGDGRLFAYFPAPGRGRIQELDRATGAAIGAPWVLGGATDDVSAYAFAHWGGTFYVFTTVDGVSSVHAVPMQAGAPARVATDLPMRIVGAGVSTCAPLLERAP